MRDGKKMCDRFIIELNALKNQKEYNNNNDY